MPTKVALFIACKKHWLLKNITVLPLVFGFGTFD
jgi:hypothetical protein